MIVYLFNQEVFRHKTCMSIYEVGRCENDGDIRKSRESLETAQLANLGFLEVFLCKSQVIIT